MCTKMLAMKNCNILCSFPLFLTAGCFSSYALYYFKAIHGMCYFPPHVIFTRSTRTNFSRSFMLTQPEHSYFHSFVPDSVRQWNSLPEHVVIINSLNNPFFITLIVPTASSLSYCCCYLLFMFLQGTVLISLGYFVHCKTFIKKRQKKKRKKRIHRRNDTAPNPLAF